MHARYQFLASIAICPSVFDRAGNNDFGTDGAERTAEITGPVVRRPVSPQLRQENLNTLRERQTSRSELHAKPSSSVSRPN